MHNRRACQSENKYKDNVYSEINMNTISYNKCIYFFLGCIPAEELKFVMNNLPGKVS
jgi:hypothetical protein